MQKKKLPFTDNIAELYWKWQKRSIEFDGKYAHEIVGNDYDFASPDNIFLRSGNTTFKDLDDTEIFSTENIQLKFGTITDIFFDDNEDKPKLYYCYAMKFPFLQSSLLNPFRLAHLMAVHLKKCKYQVVSDNDGLVGVHGDGDRDEEPPYLSIQIYDKRVGKGLIKTKIDKVIADFREAETKAEEVMLKELLKIKSN